MVTIEYHSLSLVMIKGYFMISTMEEYLKFLNGIGKTRSCFDDAPENEKLTESQQQILTGYAIKERLPQVSYGTFSLLDLIAEYFIDQEKNKEDFLKKLKMEMIDELKKECEIILIEWRRKNEQNSINNR